LPISKDNYKKNATLFRQLLSLSFPLGFHDLYVGTGQVILEDVTHCTDTPPYYCPGGTYDFGTSNDTDKGSSGSPLIDLESGDVIGVTSAGTIEANANYTWAIDASRYKDIK
jgi:hypothetical protein